MHIFFEFFISQNFCSGPIAFLKNNKVFKTEKNIRSVTPIWSIRLTKWKPNSLFFPKELLNA